jgi:hypothetical protein
MAFQNIVGTKLAQGALATTVKILFTCPPNTRTYVKDITICNTANASATARVYLVPASATPLSAAAASNALFYDVALAANTTLHWTGTQILNPGDTIQASASAVTCTIFISGGLAT